MTYKSYSDLFEKRKDIIISQSKRRIAYFSAPFALFYLIIILRLLTLTVSYIENTSIDIENIKKPRSIILDRNGIILATNLSTSSIFANPNKVIDIDSSAKKIMSVLNTISYSNLMNSLTSKRNFVWIKRHITPKELLALKAFGLPGIGFKKDEKRIYPQGNLFAHVIGYTDIDGNGLSGIEKYINSNNASNNIILSVDLRIQNIVYKELKSTVEKFSAIGGSGIVLDARNGEILSMVSIPDFDLNNQSQANNSQRFNRASLGIYEMGSILKMFTVASALDTNTVTLNDTFNILEPLNIGQFTINDFYKFDRQYLTVQEIFAKSSNIGIAKIALKLGSKLQIEYLERFNLLSPLSIEIPEKSYPITPKRWNDITSTTVSYGYGLAITPVHVVQATASLVNGGIMNPATLILKDTARYEDEMDETRVIQKSTSDMMCKLLRLAVKKGSGKKADARGYLVGGKTGSAEKVIGGKYNKDSNISSFIGVFPITNPKYVVFILIDEPHGDRTVGGIVAAPIVKNIINKIAPILNIPPEKNI